MSCIPGCCATPWSIPGLLGSCSTDRVSLSWGRRQGGLMAKRSPGSVRGTATGADSGCHGASGVTGQPLGEKPIYAAGSFAGSFCRAGGGTGCPCFTRSQGTLHRTRIKGQQREKIQAMDSFIWSLTPTGQGRAGAGARCLCCSLAAGHELDQGGDGASGRGCAG